MLFISKTTLGGFNCTKIQNLSVRLAVLDGLIVLDVLVSPPSGLAPLLDDVLGLWYR